ncbi:MAG TPA: GvpL/GvpF family gas vesicle protein [Vulgatibacter sp.]|nr:GvpL/GvpF family gas vesicle protein [Vulgatibacter sp.]
MTAIVYGVAEARRLAEEELPRGLDGAKLVAVEHGDLAALLSRVERGAGHADAERALAFADVVDRLHRRMTILPMRYGCFLPRPEAAKAFLRRHERELGEALAALDGCEEVGLRLLLPRRSGRAGRSDAPTGRAYLLARRRFYEEQDRAEQTARAWAERAETALAGGFRESRREHVDRPDGTLLSLSFLVERSETAAFLEACGRFRSELPGEIAAVCTGPFPPYVFVAGLIEPDPARAERELFERLKG